MTQQATQTVGRSSVSSLLLSLMQRRTASSSAVRREP